MSACEAGDGAAAERQAGQAETVKGGEGVVEEDGGDLGRFPRTGKPIQGANFAPERLGMITKEDIATYCESFVIRRESIYWIAGD